MSNYRPLADELRPATLDDVVGQEHILGAGGLLRRVIESGNVPNMIFYGPSGSGKTTVANIIAATGGRVLRKLNATTAGIADIKAIIEELDTFLAPNGVLLYLDEIQYFNKKQQQSLLEFIENGKIILIASTTENPYFCVYNAVLSRSTVFEFKPITAQDVEKAVLRAVKFLEERDGLNAELEDGVTRHIAASCGGDARKAINAVELLFSASRRENGKISVTLDDALAVSQRSAMRYDRDGDDHYDILSALHKSIRGSDTDAALHYLARLLEAGDILSPCRRILCAACEDIGPAYPLAIPIVKACVDAAVQLGLPEARLPLSDAVILLTTAPKSNSALAIDAALDDVRAGKIGNIPRELQNVHADGAGFEREQGYLYPHSFPNSYVVQQYLPDVLKGAKYYEFGDNKTEQAAKKYWDAVKNHNSDNKSDT
ncbi:MAG: replication-associated recombination protein A [Oscillospiraceae bacterium]|jgi:putative ATPase|nr:replication-associated recombination protein A [Oscillospiraceae bacterium]